MLFNMLAYLTQAYRLSNIYYLVMYILNSNSTYPEYMQLLCIAVLLCTIISYRYVKYVYILIVIIFSDTRMMLRNKKKQRKIHQLKDEVHDAKKRS